jgi:hypothetical protein
LQAAKRKHFKQEDKRMNHTDELELKRRLTNESPNVKIKWAVRLLMKLRKDIQKEYQKELVDIIVNSSSASSTATTMNSISSKEESNNLKLYGSNNKVCSKCIISNPDMKGKMRRIDCLRQSDKVWRLDLVMVVLFKGIPLESSDGERLDKLSECLCPQLCINPDHALLSVRDLEIYLANYINSSTLSNNSCNVADDGNMTVERRLQLNCSKNILSPSVFTPQEFLTLSGVSILDGASDADLKCKNVIDFFSSLNFSYLFSFYSAVLLFKLQ